jgi:hypothetical protein
VEEGEEEGEEEEEEERNPLPSPSSAFNIDYGISLPCKYNTPTLYTSYLQQLASQEGNGCILVSQTCKPCGYLGGEFYINYMLFIISHIILG